MKKEVHLRIDPSLAGNEAEIEKKISGMLNVPRDRISGFHLRKRSVDARRKPILLNLIYEVYIDEPFQEVPSPGFDFPMVQDKRTILIIGAGPAGLFAALQCLREGFKPVIFERGKNVKERRRDIARLNREHVVNPDSNYCFGEGGAGTFSDGKLYTRSGKRGNIQEILELFVFHGADPEILVDAHPHIGTNRLPGIIENIRETILNAGGEIHFNSRVTDLLITNNSISGIEINKEVKISGDKVILATGHSSRDIYDLLHSRNILIEAKPFALGVRVEHSQELIDSIQYHCQKRPDSLPPASYSLLTRVNKKGAFSFCMCPGGIIAPCATSPEEIVTNGWSPSRRNNPFANSGIVVETDPSDWQGTGPLAGLKFQQSIEKKAWQYGGGGQTAPAQRLMDFIENINSSTLPRSSYLPGINSAPLGEILPPFVTTILREAFKDFGKKMKGYLTNEAVVHAVESRTSSPVRIPRDRESLEHTEISGLYPVGEGAGYAGGIVSAAMDGIRCVKMIKKLTD